MLKKMPGMKIDEEEKVPETDDVQKTMESMIQLDGATLLFPTSFGYFDPYMLRMATKYPKIEFRHCGGLWTDKNPKNAGSYFGYIGMCQYLNGIAAGHATKSKKLGFIAAKPIPQVLENINSFALGARSVDPSITTTVIFTGDWSMPVKEAEAANSLADQGIDVITCHVDGPKVIMETAERRGIFCCGYHANQSKLAPKGYLTGAEWNWITVYKMFVGDMHVRQAAAQLRARRPEGELRQDVAVWPRPVRRRSQERRYGEGGNPQRRLLGVQGADEGQQGQRGDPRWQGVPGNRGRTGIDELPGRGRERRDLLIAPMPSHRRWRVVTEAIA